MTVVLGASVAVVRGAVEEDTSLNPLSVGGVGKFVTVAVERLVVVVAEVVVFPLSSSGILVTVGPVYIGGVLIFEGCVLVLVVVVRCVVVVFVDNAGRSGVVVVVIGIVVVVVVVVVVGCIVVVTLSTGFSGKF